MPSLALTAGISRQLALAFNAEKTHIEFSSPHLVRTALGMARRYYSLPPLTTLAAFEAAARHLSFKEAAQELSVTPGAVSHQIKALEGDLGAALFRRGHRNVELTQDGEALFEALASSFAKVSHCLQAIRARRSGDVVTI